MDNTTLFNIDDIQDALVETTLDEVYTSLLKKGYNPVNQIVGYLISGDSSYITNYENARTKILSIDRGKIIEAIVRSYLEN
ncbi:MAG TPA: IreB family regulatory phosphoprotein [Bacilli bacterium]|jgi:uncharacterized protein (UPF0297 family)|nr:IreB family regulatory phosphoprotein [Bacilli bacterium]